tara:strand:+ start:191 stop:385 length:195 start_codon:yes stop_codon:yes gene_type:complete
MKFHSTLVEQLITLFEVNSGWKEQRKLREALANYDLTVYTQENGATVLVSTAELEKALRDQKGS